MDLKRKFLAAIVSSVLFATIFASIGGFVGDAFFTIFYLNLTIMLLIGIGGSLLSDWLGKKMVKHSTAQEILSFLLHIAIGSAFQTLGLASAMLYYIVDRLLKKFDFHWKWIIVLYILSILGFFLLAF